MEHQTYGDADRGILRAWTANGLNQLTGQVGGAVFTSYDADGNLLGDGTRTYAWDAENRLVAVSGPFGTAAWEYDAFNRRVRQHDTPPDAAEQVRELIWEGLTLIESRTAGEVRKYYGNGEERMPNPATPGDAASSLRLYYTTDHLGSIREMVDETGAVRASYDYKPYGERNKLGGDLDSDFGYTGHYTHDASGLVAAPYRIYDPRLGRWLSRDPIGEEGGINLYGYVGNRPLGAMDSTGLWPDGPPNERVERSLAKLGEDVIVPASMEALGFIGDVGQACDDAFRAVTGQPIEALGPIGAEYGSAMRGLRNLGTMARGCAKVAKVVPKITFKTGHVSQHLKDLGLTAEKVEAAIGAEVKAVAEAAEKTGEFIGRVTVDGKIVEFRAFTLPDGTINVGTYYPPKR